MSNRPFDELLRPAEVAQRLGINPQTLAVWRAAGSGPPVVRLGGRWRYPAAGLAAWIEARTRGGPERAEAPHGRAA